jgi:SAM-dependent methyltransferase
MNSVSERRTRAASAFPERATPPAERHLRRRTLPGDVAGDADAGTVGVMDLTDVVACSVAAYSHHIGRYTADRAGDVAEIAERFCEPLEVDDVILDAGCGPGRDLVRFAERGFCAIGVDLNRDFAHLAAAATDGWPVHVRLGDLRHLPVADDEVAATWACAALVHLPPADAALALAEIARVTRAGGQVYLSVKTGIETGWHATAHGRRWFHSWDPSDLCAHVVAAGMAVDDRHIDGEFVNVFAHVLVS